jgi:hypothetical protein
VPQTDKLRSVVKQAGFGPVRLPGAISGKFRIQNACR